MIIKNNKRILVMFIGQVYSSKGEPTVMNKESNTHPTPTMMIL
jgi:hypothetical protein